MTCTASRGVTDILHKRGERDVVFVSEQQVGSLTARTWQVTSTWTCTAIRHDSLRAVKNDGCVCPDALLRRAKYEKGRRTGQIPPLTDSTGVQRRLQALAVIGYPSRFLAARLGLDPANLWQLRSGRRSQVSGRVRLAICDLYEELSGTPGPSLSAMKRARAKGWLPPLAYDDGDIDDIDYKNPNDFIITDPPFDFAAVERTLAGERLPLTDADRVEVARRLLEQGHGVGRVSEVLHMNSDYARRLIAEVAA